MLELYRGFQDFMQQGGPVLWPILLATALLWGLILERYWYLWRVHPRFVADLVTRWRQRTDFDSWYANQIRAAGVSRLVVRQGQLLGVIKTLVALLPMLGLLGTVTGMIRVFDVMAVTGTGNPRAMAEGVSTATIPTMAGLFGALTGVYFSVSLQQRLETERGRIDELLGAARGEEA